MRKRCSSLSPLMLATLATLGLGACVFGFRGEVSFANEANLAGVETIRLELPPTDLTLAGEASRSFIDWSGTWRALGGGANDALERARAAELRWETWEQVGRLSAFIPLDTRDHTSLASLEVESASYLAHEIVGAGSVFISGVDAFVSVDLEGGDVEILGGTEQLVVNTEQGNIELTTSAAVDVYSGFGGVIVRSEAARDIEIEDAGEIRVGLEGADHLGSGSYRRTLGTGAQTLRVRAGGGRVELATAPDAN